MKKLINNPDTVVKESMLGFSNAYSDILEINKDPLYVKRKERVADRQVAVVSGGGSGHEPLHAGYVGRGMLSAACPGDVFTSPTPDQIEAATTAVESGGGALYIIKNYTGDVMNFDMAAELCEAAGIQVSRVLINDDVAVEDSTYTAGRRGVGCTVIAEKIAGAAAERGYDLQRVTALCSKVNENGRSMGMALTPCTVPSAGKATFSLKEDEIEMGIGIHGEPGRERQKLMSAKEITEKMVESIVSDLPFKRDDRVIVLLNGMGGTPLIELYLLYNELKRITTKIGITICRSIVGNYITSLEMQGFSISMVKADDGLLSLWDDPVHTPALRW